MHDIGPDKSTPVARRGRTARGLSEAAQPPKPDNSRTNRDRRAWFARSPVLLLALMAACDVRQPVAPVPAPDSGAVPRALSGPVPPNGFSQSTALGTPGTNTGGGGMALSPGAVFPKPMWVRVRTSGKVYYEINPDAVKAPCMSPCVDHVAPHGPGGEVGASGIPGTSQLRASAVVGTAQTGFHAWTPIEIEGGQLEDIFPVQAGMELRVSRNGIQGVKYCIGCNPPVPPIGWYNLGGATAFLVEEIIPLQVAARQAEVARGDSVAFEAVAVERTRNFTWTYVATEFGAQVEVRLDRCYGQTTCSYAPRRGGYMSVTGEWGPNTTFSARSEPVRVVDAKLKLECTPNPIVRGDLIGCVAKSDPPGGTVTETKWNFTDTLGNQALGPDGALEWPGRMVIGGTMRVTARISGQPHSASTTITVRARVWPNLRLQVREQNPNHLPPPAAVDRPDELGDSHVDSLPGYPTATISDGGPNDGWIYLRDPLPPIPFIVHINEPAFARGSAWYNLQTGGHYTDSAGTVHHNMYCRKSDVPRLRRLTREHEGSASSALTSHAEVASRFLQRNKVQDHMERVMVRGDKLIGITVHSYFQGEYVEYVESPIMGDPNQNHTNDPLNPGLVPPAPFPCYARPWN